MMEFYSVKRATFLGAPIHYICQNINGPCPLLAICNVLILRRHLNIQSYIQDNRVSAQDLIQTVKDHLIATNNPSTAMDELTRLTKEKTVSDVIEILPSLLLGLDVNVRFHSTTDFEYTIACAVFDMLDISLVHGWIIDEQDERTMNVVAGKSYNELVEYLVDYRAVLMTEKQSTDEISIPTESEQMISEEVASKVCKTEGDETAKSELGCELRTLYIDSQVPASPTASQTAGLRRSPCKETVQTMMNERKMTDSDAVMKAILLLEQGPVLEEFFNTSASQLTYFGLIKLHEDVRERQLCVFFRNNHFSTLFKFESSLYLLVTDSGYLDEPTVVWERLNEIDGDTEYLNADFKPLQSSETQQQSIFQQAQSRVQPCLPQQEIPASCEAIAAKNPAPLDADYALALKLQEEEEKRVQPSEQRHIPPPAPATNNNRTTTCASDEEIQVQREAEAYYKEQKRRQQSRSSQPARPSSSRGRSDCLVM